MKKKANFLKAFALLLTLGWVSEAKSQTCDFSYNNTTNCDVVLILNYFEYSTGTPASPPHQDTLFANTQSTFHIPDCENSPNPPNNVVVLVDG